jgi:dolichol-phosphate mannosyltransferase
MNKSVDISVVSPFFNEELSIVHFCKVLRGTLEALGKTYEVILVNDGSTDRSLEVLKTVIWPECNVLCLARNSGHQVAIEAGYQVAGGSWVVTLDSDLQHPPIFIRDLLDKAEREGLDVVYAVRPDRGADSALKKISALVFYRLISLITSIKIAPNAADFRIISRSVLDRLNTTPGEKVYRLLIPSFGFRSGSIYYDADERFAGVSKYSPRKMFSLALNSAIGFSIVPLRIASVIGGGFALVGFTYATFVLICYFLGATVSGWASLMISILVLGGFQLLALGLLGEYIGRIYQTLKQGQRFTVSHYGPLNEN